MWDSGGHKVHCGVGTTAKSHQNSRGWAEEITHVVNTKVLALLTGGPDSRSSLVYHPGFTFQSE